MSSDHNYYDYDYGQDQDEGDDSEDYDHEHDEDGFDSDVVILSEDSGSDGSGDDEVEIVGVNIPPVSLGPGGASGGPAQPEPGSDTTESMDSSDGLDSGDSQDGSQSLPMFFRMMATPAPATAATAAPAPATAATAAPAPATAATAAPAPDADVDIDHSYATPPEPPAPADPVQVPAPNPPAIASPVPDRNDDEEGNSCLICYEPFTNSGDHRICCLKCGHTYGKKCIETWIKSEARCPQCNSHATRRDIRIIYVKNLKALDTAERDRVLEQLQAEQELKRKLELECARLRMLTSSKDDQIKKLSTELDGLKERAGNIYRGAASGSGSGGFENHPSGPLPGTSAATIGRIVKGSILTCIRNFQFQDAQCRVGAFDDWLNMLTLSQSVRSALYPNGSFGIKRINLQDLKATSVTPLHSKEIRDLEFSNSKGGFLLSVGLDKRAVLSNCNTNVTVQTFNADAPLWSCCWNLQNQNLFYAGTQNGSVLIYDVRNPNQVLSNLVIPDEAGTGGAGGGRSPVARLKFVTPSYSNSTFTLSGLLVQRLNSVWFCEIRAGSDDPIFHQLPIEGSFMSMDFDSVSRHVLVTTRPSAKDETPGNNTCKNIVCQLTQYFSDAQQSNICSCNIVQTYSCDQTFSGRIFRSSIFSPDNHRTLVASNGPLRTAKIWDVSDTNMFQSFPVPDQILDFVPCKISNGATGAGAGNNWILAMISKDGVGLFKEN